MNLRERFCAVTHFKELDRIPFEDWGYWPETRERWKNEGLPEEVAFSPALEEYFGFDPRRERFLINIYQWALPQFEEKVLEETDEHVVMINKKNGAKVKKGKNKDTYFEQVLEAPVKDTNEFKRYTERLNASTPGRFPEDWDRLIKEYQHREHPIGLNFCGFQAIQRGLLGFENCACAYYDNPDLIEEITDYWLNYLIELSNKAIEDVRDIDFVQVWEDMAMNQAPFVSPEIFRKFVMPAYKTLTAYFRKRGIDIIMMDSDGNMNPLVALLWESGINGLYPMEVRSGMDVVSIRKEFPRMVIQGGINKFALEKGPAAIDEELDNRLKLSWLIKQGGYIPTIDHRVHPGVSLKDYRYYVEKKKQIIFSEKK